MGLPSNDVTNGNRLFRGNGREINTIYDVLFKLLSGGRETNHAEAITTSPLAGRSTRTYSNYPPVYVAPEVRKKAKVSSCIVTWSVNPDRVVEANKVTTDGTKSITFTSTVCRKWCSDKSESLSVALALLELFRGAFKI